MAWQKRRLLPEEIHEDPRDKHGKLLIEKIEASLAAGKPSVPWRQSWDPEMSPRNIRGNMYRGGNLLMTLFARRSIRMLLRRSATMLSGYSSPFFLGAARLRLAASSVPLPYNQAVEHGGIVKPGESGWRVIEDEGPGISPRRMGDIFLNYGASTRRRSGENLR